ncbi:alkaline phosphatase D family protein [Pseudomonas sp. GD03860]|uniref:alkaline phosphatase D family protein n=1 Tax=Pseudomonas TaxID=286 RepID=UPI0023631D33|nr:MULTISPECIES: alkaline phosphatase D family protein [Pseudomonas]MDD2058543.1 alkaline phosphatase D family protein [Pseudomonas putida]MDH0640725.1 alkaline phosphatase D family protein [Pseudomonas sp. GD03860]
MKKTTPDAPATAAFELNRREILEFGLGAAALGMLGWPAMAGAQNDSDWNPGQLTHLIPTANHERFLIKASFQAPLQAAPYLLVDGKVHAGVQTDPQGRFWRFDVAALRPATAYELRITDRSGAPLCDAWPLKTFPDPDATPKRLRILAYTCAGGYDGPTINGKTIFLDMAARRQLLARGLAFEPDVVIANGDHIYYDLETSISKPRLKQYQEMVWPKFGGPLDIRVPMLHPRNEAIFTRVCDYQISGLYGTSLRSTPAFFVTDDHDMFENDEFDDKLATLPPDSYGTLGAEQTQQLYYPEFLPDRNRPHWLPGGNKAHLAQGSNMCFGTLRYGTLLEAVLYDCRRYLDNKGIHAKVLPRWVEDWLLARTAAQDTEHFMHVPSLPFGYSSGKLGDWYPDLLDKDTGKLTLDIAKPGWQAGWFDQHQRLLQALGAQTRRAPVIIQGDFHASAVGRIKRSADLALANPVHVVMTGTLGTGDLAFPSSVRSIESSPSLQVDMEQTLPPMEKNGFTVIDVTPQKLVFSLYTWRPPQALGQIDSMQPTLVYEIPRTA